MKIDITTLVAVLCIAVIEIFAIVYHVNGQVLALSLTCIAGLGGYQIGSHRGK